MGVLIWKWKKFEIVLGFIHLNCNKKQNGLKSFLKEHSHSGAAGGFMKHFSNFHMVCICCQCFIYISWKKECSIWKVFIVHIVNGKVYILWEGTKIWRNASFSFLWPSQNIWTLRNWTFSEKVVPESKWDEILNSIRGR